MRIPILLLLALSQPAQAAAPALTPLEAKLTVEEWKLPQGGEAMGMVGLQLHRTWQTGGYAGCGGWGALRGTQGGFIALGLSGGWRFPLGEHLTFDAGAWVGGGGVGRAGVGGGLMMRTHAGLAWEAPWGALGLELARVNFPNGTLASTQGALSARFPFTLVTGGTGSGSLTSLAQGLGTDLGWRDLTLLATAQRYSPRGEVVDLGGRPDTASLELAGLEARLGLGRGAFLLLDMSGAAGGKADGYMDLLVGLGYACPLDSAGRISLVGRLAGGPAGGGHLDVGGGMAWKAMAGLEATTLRGYQIGISAGYIATPGASFKGTVLQCQAGRRFELAVPGGRPGGSGDGVDWTGWGFEGGWQRFASSARVSGARPEALDLVSLQVFHELGDHLYAIGQGNFALTGHAGGFAQGLLGLGLSSAPLLGRGPRFQAQALVGAAGGGGLDTGGGLLFQPMVGLEQSLTPELSLRVMGGRCIAPRGTLRTNVFEAGVAWRFRVPARR